MLGFSRRRKPESPAEDLLSWSQVLLRDCQDFADHLSKDLAQVEEGNLGDWQGAEIATDTFAHDFFKHFNHTKEAAERFDQRMEEGTAFQEE
jgi:hypothetical protein